MEKLPRQKTGILVRKIGQETMLYDPDLEMIHILNATAESVWNRCDGKTKIDEIKQEIKGDYLLTQDYDFIGDIRQILSDFSRFDLLSN